MLHDAAHVHGMFHAEVPVTTNRSETRSIMPRMQAYNASLLQGRKQQQRVSATTWVLTPSGCPLTTTAVSPFSSRFRSDVCHVLETDLSFHQSDAGWSAGDLTRNCKIHRPPSWTPA